MSTPTWQDRAIRATRETRFGVMLLSALGIIPEHPPSCGRPAITADGFLIGGFTTEHGEHHMGAFLGGVDDLRANILGLAKHLNMTSTERKEYYAMWQKWIAIDYRTPPGLRLEGTP